MILRPTGCRIHSGISPRRGQSFLYTVVDSPFLGIYMSSARMSNNESPPLDLLPLHAPAGVARRERVEPASAAARRVRVRERVRKGVFLRRAALLLADKRSIGPRGGCAAALLRRGEAARELFFRGGVVGVVREGAVSVRVFGRVRLDRRREARPDAAHVSESLGARRFMRKTHPPLEPNARSCRSG